MSVNSRQKGARIEREAAKFLCSLGFKAERMARIGKSADDLFVKDLPNVHIEVKGNKAMSIWSDLLFDAWFQANTYCNGRKPVVLWKLPFRDWCLTWIENACEVTTVGGTQIEATLRRLNGA